MHSRRGPDPVVRASWRSAAALGLVATVAWLSGCGASVATPGTLTAAPATPTAGAPATRPVTIVETTAPATPAPTAGGTGGATTQAGLELASPGHLLSCTDIRGTVMSSLDEDGKPIGVNIELAEEIAERLGLEPRIEDRAFETIIDAIEDGACDIGISSMHITQARLERIEMIPISQGTQHVIVRVGNPAGIRTLADLCGKALAVQSGSTHVDLVRGLGDHAGGGLDAECEALGLPAVDLQEYEEDQDAVDALAKGEAVAYIGSDFVTVDRPSEFELSVALPATRNGIGVAKGKPLLYAAVNGAVRSMIDDGAYRAILEKYGAEDISIAE